MRIEFIFNDERICVFNEIWTCIPSNSDIIAINNKRFKILKKEWGLFKSTDYNTIHLNEVKIYLEEIGNY